MPPRVIQQLPHVHCAARGGSGGRRSRLRVLQLTDMHLWPVEDTSWAVLAKGGRVIDFERDGYDPHGERAVHMVKQLLARDPPDLVVFTGDIIDGRPFGERAYAGGEEEARSAWIASFEQVTAPLLACDPPVPWTFCPGNHDDDHSPWSRDDLLRIFKLPGCATPTATSFNFTFTIGTRATAGEEISQPSASSDGRECPTLGRVPRRETR